MSILSDNANKCFNHLVSHSCFSKVSNRIVGNDAEKLNFFVNLIVKAIIKQSGNYMSMVKVRPLSFKMSGTGKLVAVFVLIGRQNFINYGNIFAGLLLI